MTPNRIEDGPACTGCGLPNYSGVCPWCRGNLDEYELELVPPFSSYRQEYEDEDLLEEDLWEDDELLAEVDDDFTVPDGSSPVIYRMW